MIHDIFRVLIGVGIAGSVISMIQFSKYCGLLNKRWTLDAKTADRYQARAQRWLAATGCFIATAVSSMFLAAIFT